MQLWLFVLGLAVLLAAMTDVLWTTLWVDGGAGPISATLMSNVWRGLRAGANGRSTVLALAGPLLIVATFTVWIGLFWLGWTLVFASGERALLDTAGRGAISWADRLYFTAYTIFTLGVGDIVPREGIWQMATVFATATGMLIVTLSVSYVVSILGAVSRKRSFASSVTALGSDAESFVRCGWTGEDFRGFELAVDSLSQDIDYLAYQYKAYPILHYYHAGVASHSSAVAVAVFDEAMTLLRFGIREEARPNSALLRKAQSSTGDYVSTLSSSFITSADSAPSPPDLDGLREAGIPTVSDQEFEEPLADRTAHRRKLLGLVRQDGREWPGQEDE